MQNTEIIYIENTQKYKNVLAVCAKSDLTGEPAPNQFSANSAQKNIINGGSDYSIVLVSVLKLNSSEDSIAVLFKL